MRKVLFILGHVFFWVIGGYIITKIFGISSVEVFAETVGAEENVVITYDNDFIYVTIITLLLSAIIFYSNVFIFLPKYFRNKNILGYAPKILGLLFLCILAILLFKRYVIYGATSEDGLFIFPSFGVHSVLLIAYTAFSFAYAFTFEWYKNEQIKNQITQEKLRTELDFLKSQVNPHFLFNTLNNLFSIAQKHEVEELSTGIGELSNLMRYMLYESNSDLVLLQRELDHIESFIEVQRLRFDEEDEILINFDKKGNMEGMKIAPLIFLPFVENAFKHGTSIDASSIINIFLDVTDGNIYFRVKNKVFNEPKLADSASGIGLENVKRRLKLIYPNKHSLDISKKSDEHIVELNIKTSG